MLSRIWWWKSRKRLFCRQPFAIKANWLKPQPVWKAIGYDPDTSVLDQVIALTQSLQASVAELEKLAGHEADDALAEAQHAAGEVLPAMLKVREAVDGLEGVVADDLWPLPTYQEMLFIK